MEQRNLFFKLSTAFKLLKVIVILAKYVIMHSKLCVITAFFDKYFFTNTYLLLLEILQHCFNYVHKLKINSLIFIFHRLSITLYEQYYALIAILNFIINTGRFCLFISICVN